MGIPDSWTEIRSHRGSWKVANPHSLPHIAILMCLVGIFAYIASSFGGALILRPQMVSPLWLGNVLLVAVLLLVRRSLWPLLLASGLAAFLLYDLQEGVPVRSIVFLILSNAIEVLVAALSLSYGFDTVPRLNSIKGLVKYSFYAVFLAPFVGAFIGALSAGSSYWASWKVAFLSEALGFLTFLPAILGWAREISATARRTRLRYLEGAALLGALILFGYLNFIAPSNISSPALLYSLVPLLLWSALRFGCTGVSTSMVVVAFLSIWGTTRARGPFLELEPINNVLSLQLFLLFAAAPFMALASLVEERKLTEQTLRRKENELLEAQRLAECGSWQWDSKTDAITWSAEVYRMAGYNPALPAPSFKNHKQFFTPESWNMLTHALERAVRTGVSYELDLQAVRPDGTKLWITCSGEVLRDASGRAVQLRGTIQNITERRRAEKVRFRHDAIVESSDDAIISKDLDGIIQSWNAGARRIFGFTEAEAVGQSIRMLIPPELCNEEDKILERLRVGERIEHYETIRTTKGGKKINVSLTISPIRDSTGKVTAASKIARDITDRKLTEASLEELSGRLIAAHEEERTRIARELHDDFSQRLALQGIGLAQLWRKLAEPEAEGRARIQELLERNQEIASDMHSLSHQLHSSKLEHVGLAPALAALCEEFSSKFQIEVEFGELGVSSDIPKNVALCLFRIAQESLGNVVKHSHAKQAQVELYSTHNEIRLRVVDAGEGFDPDGFRTNAGIGLVSIRERLRLVGGKLSVRSAPMRGTEILAQVPLRISANETHVSRTASL